MAAWRRFACTITTLLVMGSCTSQNDEPAGRFEQTWSKSYSQTICSEWLDEMTPDQRRVAAADMLVGAQETDGGTSLPGDELIRRFQDDISASCQPVGELVITEVAAAVYTLDTSYLP